MADVFIKRFLAWIGIKKKLDANDYNPPLVNEGDLWWCSVGENIGVEVSGKGENFTRPVIVLKKFGRVAFFGIPITTNTERNGSWYVAFKHKGVDEVAMLTQARMFSYKRLDRKMGRLDDEDCKKVKEAFIGLFSK
jgi:mRNA interferase MazF